MFSGHYSKMIAGLMMPGKKETEKPGVDTATNHLALVWILAVET